MSGNKVMYRIHQSVKSWTYGIELTIIFYFFIFLTTCEFSTSDGDGALLSASCGQSDSISFQPPYFFVGHITLDLFLLGWVRGYVLVWNVWNQSAYVSQEDKT